MEPKIELKIKAFEYIIHLAALWHAEKQKEFVADAEERAYGDYIIGCLSYGRSLRDVWNKDKYLETTLFSVDIQPLTKEHLVLFPFLVCLVSKERALYSTFDTFIAAKNGVIEQDLLTHYDFNSDTISRCQSKRDFDLPENVKTLIDDSMSYFKEKTLFIYLEAKTLSFYHQLHISWQVWSGGWSKYLKTKNDIPMEILMRDKSIFATDPKLLSFC